MASQSEWDLRFMYLAFTIGQWSKDPSTKCGAVIVDKDKRIVSTGYNGLPRGVPDDSDILDDRATKLSCILHAEHNAILFAHRDLTGCTIYVTPMSPCAHCASQIIQVGLKRVVTTDYMLERWAESFQRSHALMFRASVSVVRLPISKHFRSELIQATLTS